MQLVAARGAAVLAPVSGGFMPHWRDQHPHQQLWKGNE